MSVHCAMHAVYVHDMCVYVYAHEHEVQTCTLSSLQQCRAAKVS